MSSVGSSFIGATASLSMYWQVSQFCR